ncbi:hypothetical protein GXP71_14800 [Cellulomonas sp. H30R-01]|uniref:hypothetical protein n=1 Tax=Cellulomonas sp. H30R-01 TaxID=2704467 RepID=UPI00138B38A8|nr:hypothetical protein [Cellulomonas sp. H30R-01]QHT57217.1 hypothetical protein GXP71_14800 [Cellulomonas sp. H30R-01]
MGVVRPAGPLPARVYWVRRVVVLGIPLLLVVLVVWLVAGRGSATPPADASPQDTPSSEPKTEVETPAADDDEDTEDTSGVPPTCTAEVLALAIAATAESFPEGTSPSFTVSITNTGTQPCVVDAGDTQREIVITSGVDRVWSSKDCPVAGNETRTLLLAGGAADESTLAWNRVRSAQGCPADQPTPGAGTYSAAFTLAGATATPVVFGLG